MYLLHIFIAYTSQNMLNKNQIPTQTNPKSRMKCLKLFGKAINKRNVGSRISLFVETKLRNEMYISTKQGNQRKL